MKTSPFILILQSGRGASHAVLALACACLLACCETQSGGTFNGAVASSSSAGVSRSKSFASSSDSASAPAPIEARPGLGTSLGGEVYDGSTATHFYRRNSHAPDLVASFHYNDEEGAKAMAELSGRPSKHSGKFSLADGRLKASLLSGWENDRLPYYEAGGKIFVMGRAGQSYSIELENPTGDTVETVVSVDGLDVLSGSPASFSSHGYVVAPHSSFVIRGMKTGGKMRSFQFGSVRDSQAAKTGGEAGARNVGVVGIALYLQDEAAARQARLAEGLRRGDANAFPR